MWRLCPIFPSPLIPPFHLSALVSVPFGHIPHAPLYPPDNPAKTHPKHQHNPTHSAPKYPNLTYACMEVATTNTPTHHPPTMPPRKNRSHADTGAKGCNTQFQYHGAAQRNGSAGCCPARGRAIPGMRVMGGRKIENPTNCPRATRHRVRKRCRKGGARKCGVKPG